MTRMLVVTLPRLRRALCDVRRELRALGLWTPKLAATGVYLVAASADAYGWQAFGGDGSISIPALSIPRFRDWLRGGYVSLRDVLRHEYAHALADTHRALVRRSKFRAAFGAPHASSRQAAYLSHVHVTPYAATAPSEDFAETFMLFVRHRGRLPARFRTPAIRQKWRFIRQLRAAIRRGQTRFAHSGQRVLAASIPTKRSPP